MIPRRRLAAILAAAMLAACAPQRARACGWQAISRLREAQEDRARLAETQAELEGLKTYVAALEAVGTCRRIGLPT